MICKSDDMMNPLPENEKDISYNHAEPAQLLNYMITRYPLGFKNHQFYSFLLIYIGKSHTRKYDKWSKFLKNDKKV